MNFKTAAAILLFGCSVSARAAVVNHFGTPAYDSGNDVVTDVAGNTILAGSILGGASFDPSSPTSYAGTLGSHDAIVAKYSIDGKLQWVDTFGGLHSDAATAIAADHLGNIYVGGGYTGPADLDPGEGTQTRTSNGLRDAFLAKLDASGKLLWLRTFGAAAEDQINDLAIGEDNSLFVAGSFSGTIDVDPLTGGGALTSAGSADGFFLHYSPDGVLLQSFPVGSTGSDAVMSVVTTGTGTLYIAGIYHGTVDLDPSGSTRSVTSAGQTDIFLARMTTDGEYLWGKTVGGPNDDVVSPGNAAVDENGRLILGGSFRETATFQTQTKTSAGSADAFVLTTSFFGAVDSVIQFGGTGLDTVEDLLTDANGAVYVGGCFSGTVDFDPGAGVKNYSTTGGSAAEPFVLKLASNFSFIWATPFQISEPTSATASLVNALAPRGIGVTTTGRFIGTLDAAEGPEQRLMTSEGSQDIFLIDLSAEGRPSAGGRSRVIRR